MAHSHPKNRNTNDTGHAITLGQGLRKLGHFTVSLNKNRPKANTIPNTNI